VVGPQFAELCAACADPLPYAVEGVAGRASPERDHVAVAQENAHRIGHDNVAVEPGGPHRDQHLVAKYLHLGPFIRGDRVFKREFADLEHGADAPDGVEVSEPFDVDPDHPPAIPAAGEFVDTRDRGFVHALAVAGDHPQDGRLAGGGWGRGPVEG